MPFVFKRDIRTAEEGWNGRAAGFWVSLGEDLQAVSGGQDYQRKVRPGPVQHYCV